MTSPPRMSSPWDAEGHALVARVAAWMEQDPAVVDVEARDRLALDLHAWQRGRCAAIDRVARAFDAALVPATIDEIPAVPTDVFRSARIACFDPAHDLRTFRTSGTTGEARGAHVFADLSLYARAAECTARRWLLPDPPYRFLLLALRPDESPDSSLSFMLERFASAFGTGSPSDACWALRNGRLDHGSVETFLASGGDPRPVAVLGASWAFVHLDDACGRSARGFELPEGSVAMPTGGFKGRSRTLEPAALFELVLRRFGLGRDAIIQEYGMTELSSQAYEDPRGGLPPGRYASPSWMHVRAVDPESLRVLPLGRTGLLRVVDLANVGSAIAIQTSDVGIVHADGFEVLGRVPGATPRGCARAIDAVLSTPR